MSHRQPSIDPTRSSERPFAPALASASIWEWTGRSSRCGIARHVVAALALALACSATTSTSALAQAGAVGDDDLSIIDDFFDAEPATDEFSLRVTGDRLAGFVLPVNPVAGDISIRATDGWAWRVDDTQRLQLRGDVRVRVAGHSFVSNEVIVWLNRIPTADGLVTQLALYFDRVSDPTQVAGFGANGENLLVTAAVRGSVTMRVPFMEQERPSSTAILVRGERRLAAHLRSILAAPQPLSLLPKIDAPPTRTVAPPVVGGSAELPPPPAPTEVTLPRDTAGLPIFDPRATVRFSGGRIVLEQADDTVVIDDGLLVDYLDQDGPGAPRRLSLTAQRGVLFLQPGTLASLRDGTDRVGAEAVVGIYLEGDVVATDGAYTLRGARIYYDLPSNQALVVDAVLRTYARGNTIPVWARAAEMRQLSQDRWSTGRSTVSTSEFFTPHLAIGAREATIWKEPGESGETIARGEWVTLRAGGLPFFALPAATGRSGEIPLRSIGFEGGGGRGAGIQTRWNLFALLGREAPAGVDADLLLEGWFERGPAVGTRFRYDAGFGRGDLDLYGLLDEGTDRTSSGRRVTPDSKYRGVALWEHRLDFDDDWSLQLQAAAISDETFITSWRRRDFVERREYETSAYLIHQKANTALTLLAKDDINGFISNDYLLASRGYSVDRMPDFSYRRYGDSIFGDRVTWSSEYRVTRMRIQPTKGTPNDLGIPGAAFGSDLDTPVRDTLTAQGYRGNWVGRADVRQELAMPLDFGPIRAVPFAVGRFTGYTNDEFESFSSDSDDLRFFASTGLRLSTEIQYVDNSAKNRLFDINRLRHIIQPSMTLWYGYSTVADGALPVYDQEVESIGDAAAVDLAMRSVWQTQRGGPGRWRSVDVLVVEGGVVVNSNDANRESPISQWFRWRPEYSQFGDHAYGSAIWTVSDTLSLSGTGVWDLEDDQLARASVGAELRHSPAVRTYVEYRTIRPVDEDLLQFGAAYQIGRKYSIDVAPLIDLNENEFRAARVDLTRLFPDFSFRLSFYYDRVLDETTVSATVGRVSF